MASAGSAKQKAMRDKQMASELKRIGQERTTGRCAQCYQIITCDGPKSVRRHVCPGSK
jgi:hypothetical protein